MHIEKKQETIVASSYYKTYKGHRLGPYSYPSKKHEFTPQDVARIAKTVAGRNGHTPLEVFAHIAVALGLSAMICKGAHVTKNALSMLTFIKKIGVILAVGNVIKTIITALLGMKPTAPWPVQLLIAIVIVSLLLVDKIIDLASALYDDQDNVASVAKFLALLCTKIHEITNEAVDSAVDSDALAAAKKALEMAAYEMKSETEKSWTLLVETSIWDEFVKLFE